ncbi:MAG: hypothetical protein J7L10_06225 [Methanomicrobia archaeon]|nr:hypothetical protein [Methanomicrobia archaeon]RLF94520.1 MAG: hypothetical protein DRN45_03210 [Thermococci archaeon]RLF98323.1 MAG: hypothetical protein DRN58_07190 [Thermococci archaeon]
MNKKIIGYTALFISIVYYSILASFIGQGLFTQASLVERYLIITTLFLMVFFNVFIGSYILGAESKVKEGISETQLYKIERSEVIDEIISHNLNNLNQIALGYLSMIEKEDISDMGKDYLKRAINTIKNSGSTIETLKRIKNMDNYEIKEININKILSELKDRYKVKKKISMDVEKDLVVKATPLISDAFEMLFSSSQNLEISSYEDSDSKYLIFNGVEMDIDLTLVKMIVESFGNTIIGSSGITIKFPK